LAAATNTSVEALATKYTQYGPLKKDAGDAVIALLDPIRNRYLELMNDRAELARLLVIGNNRAREVAARTLGRAHNAIGLLPRI